MLIVNYWTNNKLYQFLKQKKFTDINNKYIYIILVILLILHIIIVYGLSYDTCIVFLKLC